MRLTAAEKGEVIRLVEGSCASSRGSIRGIWGRQIGNPSLVVTNDNTKKVLSYSRGLLRTIRPWVTRVLCHTGESSGRCRTP